MILINDLKYALRLLIKNPGFTLVAVITLALGIGANTAIFSVLIETLIRPLPYNDPQKLVMIWETLPSAKLDKNTVAKPNYFSWRDNSQTLQEVGAFTTQISNLTGAGETEQIRGYSITPNMFPLLGASPQYGRNFTIDEGKEGSAPVVIISQSLLQRRFNSDPSIVGKTITIANKSFNVIGVMPQNFVFPRVLTNFNAEFYVPLRFNAEDASDPSRNIFVIGKLKDSVAVKQVQADLENLAARIKQENPDIGTGFGVNVLSLDEEIRGSYQTPLLVIFAAAGFVLLIACVNVANLLLSRAVTRRKESAIRAALGASRWQLIKHFLTESFLLSVAGGTLGILLATWGISLLIAIAPAQLEEIKDTKINLIVLLFALGISSLTGMICGLIPAFQSFRHDLNETLKDAGKQSGMARSRASSVLVVAELALALILLVGAGLLLKTFYQLNSVDMGFRSENLLTFGVSLSSVKYQENEKRVAFFDALLPRLATLPGVISVGAISDLPVSSGARGSTFIIEGRQEPNDSTPLCYYRITNPDYFRTMTIPLASGRLFDQQDISTSEHVTIISESLAKASWGNENPLGKRIKWGDGKWMTIVGIVKDIKLTQKSDIGPHVYMPYRQVEFPLEEIALKMTGDPLSLSSAIRNEVNAVDKDVAVANIRTMDNLLSGSIARQRFNATLIVLFASLALILSAIGIYGVMSYDVSQRTQEIGIRMALGAKPGDVINLVLGRGLIFSLIGIAIGILGAFYLSRLMKSLLFEVSPTNFLTYLSVSVVLLVIAMLACYIPARRAARVNPLTALKHE